MPNPNLNMGTEYFCLKKNEDLDWDEEPCEEFTELARCRQCVYFEQQNYTIVTRREDQKHLI